MQGAIEAFANQISPTEIDPTLVVSKALTLYDGTVASGGNRYDNAAIAMYEFKTGQGTVAYDTSGVEPSLDLNLSGDVTWVGGWGLNLRGGKAQGSTSASKKLHDLIKATGEYSVEAWVAPANVVQEEAHIVGYSAGTMARNFTLGQTMYDYDFFHRSTTNDANGDPALSTPSADEILQATLQHVVAVFDPVEGRRIYVNGELVTQVDPVMAGSLTDWDDTFAFVLGNEVSNDRTWEGVIRLVAVHNRVLTEDQIRQNFEAGVGEKFFLLFSVEHLIDVPESYVMFEVAQFDSYGYLFDKATFISLDPNAEPADIPIAGIRIGINGAEASVGQAYRPVDTTLSVANGYDPATGQRLSPVGTVIGLEKGPEYDEFFLSFDVLGDNLNVRTDPAPLTPQTPADRDREADIGLRTFDEINETMATVTGVSPNQADVRATFETVRQALPAVENVNGFLASQQMAVAQLAIEYCNALVEDTGLRSSFFPSVNFGQTAATQQSAIIDPLLDRLMGTNLVSQPDPTEVRTELEALIGRLTNCPGGCEPDRTETVAKAACAAVMGSAVTLVQ
jgi:hypothetical protein